MRIPVLAIAFASFCFASEHHQANIVGYPVGEFAVKGDIEKYVTDYVVEPLSIELSKARGSQVEFTVIGSADQTGNSAANDRLAKSRAEELAAYLSGKFPSAKFITLTKGDERDARMTSVSWEVIAAAPGGKQQAGIDWPMYAKYAGLVGILALVIILLCRKKEVVQQQPLAQASSNLREMPKLTDEELFKVETDEAIYFIPVPFKDTKIGKMWVTPFLTQEHPRELIMRKDRQLARKAVASCVKNPFYKAEIEELAAAQNIKIERRKEIA